MASAFMAPANDATARALSASLGLRSFDEADSLDEDSEPDTRPLKRSRSRSPTPRRSPAAKVARTTCAPHARRRSASSPLTSVASSDREDGEAEAAGGAGEVKVPRELRNLQPFDNFNFDKALDKRLGRLDGDEARRARFVRCTAVARGEDVECSATYTSRDDWNKRKPCEHVPRADKAVCLACNQQFGNTLFKHVLEPKCSPRIVSALYDTPTVQMNSVAADADDDVPVTRQAVRGPSEASEPPIAGPSPKRTDIGLVGAGQYIGTSRGGSPVYIGSVILCLTAGEPGFPGLVVSGCLPFVSILNEVCETPTRSIGIVWLGLEGQENAEAICIALEDVDRVVRKASELPTPRFETLAKSYKDYKLSAYERQLKPAYEHARSYLDQTKPVVPAPKPLAPSSRPPASPGKSRPPSASPAKAAAPKPQPKPILPPPPPPPPPTQSLADWFVTEIDVDSAELAAVLTQAGLNSPSQLLRLRASELDTLIDVLVADGRLTLLQQIWLRGRVRPRLQG